MKSTSIICKNFKRIYPTSGDSLLQQEHHILVDDTRAIKSLGPANEQTFGEAQLLQRKREGEPKRQSFCVHIVLLNRHTFFD